ncbi:30S ribosomal protein S1 [Limnochorda pilosa]|uniref:S1 motif domain-containing protein n=1 Tax=Limnochorda pilosa TaxID=1555112 RepID=A0A0K2SKJ0_LIMPI|nr:30S ribosomal protein S1 [Limnochorda pilosa]BAS27626.1 hypothetical protein LIP_1782 [Limnochorda pilosa]
MVESEEKREREELTSEGRPSESEGAPGGVDVEAARARAAAEGAAGEASRGVDPDASGEEEARGEESQAVDGYPESLPQASGEATLAAAPPPEEAREEAAAREAHAVNGAVAEATASEAPRPADATPAWINEPGFEPLSAGQIVRGHVAQVNDDEVLVDVGYKTEGRIPLHELNIPRDTKPSDLFKRGDEIDVFVIKVEDAEGTVLLSKRRADYRLVWERLERHFKEGEPLEARVTERVKGGLLVDVGVRGFLPASHVDIRYVEDLSQFVGQTLRLKVIEIDRQRNNVVLSRKEVLEKEMESSKVELLASLKPGTAVDGVVRRLTDFGAFVELEGGVEGLLHVSEMAWSRVRHPRDVVKEGQKVKVKVLSVDPAKGRISLSLKGAQPDPWRNIHERYQIGELVTGEVTRTVEFGAFVKLEDGVEGLVHISQLASHHVNDASEVVQTGDQVTVKVISLDPKARRIGLSLKEAREDEERLRTSQFNQSRERDSVKLGDVFGELQELLDERHAAEDQEVQSSSENG